MRVAVQAGESAPVSAVKRAEQQSPGQPTTGSVTAGGDPEREFASDRRRQAQAARPRGRRRRRAELEARRTRHLPRRCPRTLRRRRRSRSGRDGAPRTAFSRARRCEAGRASGRSYPNNRPGHPVPSACLASRAVRRDAKCGGAACMVVTLAGGARRPRQRQGCGRTRGVRRASGSGRVDAVCLTRIPESGSDHPRVAVADHDARPRGARA